MGASFCSDRCSLSFWRQDEKSLANQEQFRDPCEWNEDNKWTLMKVVADHKGHMRTNKNFRDKWRVDIVPDLSDQLKAKMPHWYYVYKKYYDFKLDVLRKYDIKSEEVCQVHVSQYLGSKILLGV